MALQKTYSGDLTWSIAKQIGSRVNQAANMAADERAYASAMAEAGGTSLEEAGIGRGYFLRRALGSRFGGDAAARTRGRFEKNPPMGRDPRGTVGSRFRGGFDYNVSSRLLGGPLGAAFGGGSRGGGGSGGGGGINPEVVPNDTILGKMINITPTAGRSGGIVVHDQKLGKFVSAVAESLSSSMNSMSTKADGIDQGVIAAKDGLTATQKQLEDVGDTLEDKLDAIIAEIRGQNNLLRKVEEDAKEERAEAEIEEKGSTATQKSGTDRLAGVGEKVDDVLAENNAEDAAAIAAQQKMLPPARQEAEQGAFIAHGKEIVGDRVIDGPDTGYLAQAEQGSTSVTPINNFFTRGQTGAASKTGGMPSGKPVIGRKISSIGNIPEVKKETEKLAKAAVLPVQASGAMTLGILGQSMGEMGGLAGEKGVETGIKKMAAPIAGMFGVKNSIANNVAGEVGSAADAAKRSASTAAGDAIKEGPFQGVFNALGNTVNWVKSLFAEKPEAEKGGHVNSTSNMVSINAEKGVKLPAIIKGSKRGYPANVGGHKINAHGTELAEKDGQGIRITPLDNFATDGIEGNEVTPGGDIARDMAFERGGKIGGGTNSSRVQQLWKQRNAMNAPPSNKTDIVQLNSKEREFNRMLTKVTKIDPVVINSTNSKTDPPPQEMQHIANKGDCALDLIYPPLV